MPKHLTVDPGSEDLTTVRFTDEPPGEGGFVIYPTISGDVQRRLFDYLVTTDEGRAMLEAVAKAGMRLQMRRFAARLSQRALSG